jgi:hypothetical protein
MNVKRDDNASLYRVLAWQVYGSVVEHKKGNPDSDESLRQKRIMIFSNLVKDEYVQHLKSQKPISNVSDTTI